MMTTEAGKEEEAATKQDLGLASLPRPHERLARLNHHAK